MDTASTNINGRIPVAGCKGETAGVLCRPAMNKKYMFENMKNWYIRARGKKETSVYLLVRI